MNITTSSNAVFLSNEILFAGLRVQNGWFNKARTVGYGVMELGGERSRQTKIG
jgi:hypothetical protein